MNTYTPGPWTCPHGARVYGADSHLVAETAFEHRGTTETEANAALMSAAPDLLAALEELLWAASRTSLETDGDYSNAFTAARVAIAKATQGQ